MNYTLYISGRCPYCIKVIDYCKEKNITCSIINLDEPTEKPKPIYAVPALFFNEELMAYGHDIISYFEKVA